MTQISRRRPQLIRYAAAACALSFVMAGCGSNGEQDATNAVADVPAAADAAVPEQAGAAVPADAGAAPEAPKAPGQPAAGAPDGAAVQAGAHAGKPAAGPPKNTSKGKAADRGKTAGAATPEAALAAKAAAYKVPAKAKATGTPVLIGNVGTYSGIGGLLNRGTQEMLRVWATWVNDHGGLNGHPVQVESYDDQGDPATAVSHAKTLQSKGVLAFLWNYTLFTSQTLIPAIDKMKIPSVGGDDFDPNMYATEYMFPNNLTPYFQDASAGKYAAERGMKKAAVWWCIEAYVCQQAQKYDDARGGLKSAGLDVVMNVSVSLTQPSYLSQCSTAKAKGVEFILNHVDGASFIRTARDCAQIDYHPFICNVAGAATPEMLTSEYRDQFCVTNGSFPWWESAAKSPMQKEFHAAIAQYAPNVTKTYGSSGVWAAGEIIRSSSKFLSAKPTAAELVKGLRMVKNETFGGLTYPLTYTTLPKALYNCGQVALMTQDSKWDFAENGKFYCVNQIPIETITKQ